MRALLQDVKISVKIGVTDYWRETDQHLVSSSGAKLYVQGKPTQTMDALRVVSSVLEEADIEVAPPEDTESPRCRKSIKAPLANHQWRAQI